MGPELVALASAAASTLVSAMASDAWQAVRSRLGKLLGRGDQNAEKSVLATLDEDAQSMADAGSAAPTLSGDLAAQWTVRLRDLLRADPDAAAAVRELMADLSAAGAHVTASGHGVAAGGNIDIRADRGGIAAGTIHGSINAPNPSQPGTDQA